MPAKSQKCSCNSKSVGTKIGLLTEKLCATILFDFLSKTCTEKSSRVYHSYKMHRLREQFYRHGIVLIELFVYHFEVMNIS